MWSMPDNEIGTGINSHMCKTDDIAAFLTMENLRPKGNSNVFIPFGTAVERNYHDIALTRQPADFVSGRINSQHIIRTDIGSKTDNRDTPAFDSEPSDVTFTPGMGDACRTQQLHGIFTSRLTKISCVIIGEIQHIEACLLQLRYIMRGSAKYVTVLRINTLLNRCTTILENPFKVTQRKVSVTQCSSDRFQYGDMLRR